MVVVMGDQMPPVPPALGVAASAAGIAFHHLYARRVEIDFVVWNLLGLAGALCLFAVYASCAWLGLPLLASLYYLGVAVASFTISLAASILLYRGYFHPLSHIPGPRLARFTSFWAVREASGDYRFHVRLKELHEKYGDVVRIGPRLVSIARADALPLTANLGKGTFFAHAGGRDDSKQGFGLSRDPEDHRVRRRPWEIAFSPKHLAKHTGRLQDAIGRFIDGRLAIPPGAPERRVDIANSLSRLSFDITGIVGFGHSFGAIEREGPEAHPALTALRRAHAVLGGLRFVPWLMNMMRYLPIGKGDFAPFIDHSEKILADHEAERRRARLDAGVVKTTAPARPHSGEDKDEEEEDDDDDENPTPKPVLSFLLDAVERGDPSAPRTREALVGESRSMIAAGADTVQSAMINCLGYLATHAAVRHRLQARADAAFPGGPDTYTYARLLANSETLAWADAVINETLRILPPAPSANARVTPPGGLVIPASAYGPRFWIPAGTELIQPPYVLHRDPRWFDRPDEFLPERWLDGRADGGEGGSAGGSGRLKCDRAAFAPFHSGKHACVGKPMAIQELRSVVVRVALRFDWALAPGQTWEAYESRVMDHFTMAVPPLYLVFRERDRRKKV